MKLLNWLNGGGNLDPRSLILIWDTGASYGLTPFHSDFIDYVECDIPVRDVTKVNKVVGIGTTLNKFTDTTLMVNQFPPMCILSPTSDGRSSILPSNIPPNARWVFQGLRTKHSDDDWYLYYQYHDQAGYD